MDKLIVPTLPNLINMATIIILILMVVSFVTLIISIIIIPIKEKIAEISYITFLISMGLGLVLAVFIAVAGHINISKKPHTITKTDDAIIVNSKSEWVKNSTYEIMGHKNGIYYLKDPEHRHSFIELSDDEVSQIIASER